MRDFESFVERDTNSSCWLWSGAPNNSGYGAYRINGKRIGEHRASYLIHVGPIPKGMQVCHKCDVRLCVNPDHLWLGTQSDNLKDCFEKGRMKRLIRPGNPNPAKGENHGRAKLTEAQVIEIRSYKRCPRQALAKKFGVTLRSVIGARRGETWKHLL